MAAMTAAPNTLTITRPDDWHLHVRDGEPLHTVVPHTAAQFGRAIIMPNLRPPVTTAESDSFMDTTPTTSPFLLITGLPLDPG